MYGNVYGYNGYGYGYGYNDMGRSNGIAVSKTQILDYLRNFAGTPNVEVVSDFDTQQARHICEGTKEIVLLNKDVIPVPTSNGSLGVEVFFCPRCRKLLVNSGSLEVY